MSVLGLVRDDIQQHLAGPAFTEFIGRTRQKPIRRRSRQRLDYGRDDKAAPVALLSAALQERLAAAPVVELTDWAAGKQYWRHGRGRQLLRRGGHVPVPAAWYAGIQQLVDDVEPERASRRLGLRGRRPTARVAGAGRRRARARLLPPLRRETLSAPGGAPRPPVRPYGCVSTQPGPGQLSFLVRRAENAPR